MHIPCLVSIVKYRFLDRAHAIFGDVPGCEATPVTPEYGHVKQFVSLHAFHGATIYMFRIGRLILGLLRLELTVSPS